MHGIAIPCERISGAWHAGRVTNRGTRTINNATYASAVTARRSTRTNRVIDYAAPSSEICNEAHADEDRERTDLETRIEKARRALNNAKRASDSNASQIDRLRNQITNANRRHKIERDAYIRRCEAEITWREVRTPLLNENVSRAHHALTVLEEKLDEQTEPTVI